MQTGMYSKYKIEIHTKWSLPASTHLYSRQALCSCIISFATKPKTQTARHLSFDWKFELDKMCFENVLKSFKQLNTHARGLFKHVRLTGWVASFLKIKLHLFLTIMIMSE